MVVSGFGPVAEAAVDGALDDNQVEGEGDEHRSDVLAFAGRQMVGADPGDACSCHTLQPHELEPQTLCTRRGIASDRLAGHSFLQARRRLVVCIPAQHRK